MLPTQLLDLVGEFSGLILKDDRRFKKATLRKIRIRYSGKVLKGWLTLGYCNGELAEPNYRPTGFKIPLWFK